MKLQDDYNPHDWSNFEVKTASRRPCDPHFAAVMFDVMQYTTPGYDHDDPTEHQSFDHVRYFAFKDQETLSQWVLRASKAGKQFFCFLVTKVGKVELKVDIDVSL